MESLYTKEHGISDLEEPFLASSNVSSKNKNDLGECSGTFLWNGFCFGFLVAMHDIMALAYMNRKWNSNTSTKFSSIYDMIWYGLVWLLAHISTFVSIVSLVSWISMSSKSGRNLLRSIYFAPHNPTERTMFILGAHFCTGAVFGLAYACVLVNMIVGSAFPILSFTLVAIAVTFLVLVKRCDCSVCSDE